MYHYYHCYNSITVVIATIITAQIVAIKATVIAT